MTDMCNRVGRWVTELHINQVAPEQMLSACKTYVIGYDHSMTVVSLHRGHPGKTNHVFPLHLAALDLHNDTQLQLTKHLCNCISNSSCQLCVMMNAITNDTWNLYSNQHCRGLCEVCYFFFFCPICIICSSHGLWTLMLCYNVLLKERVEKDRCTHFIKGIWNNVGPI